MVGKEGKEFGHEMTGKEKNGLPNPSVFQNFSKMFPKMFYKSFQERLVDAISTRETN